MSQSLLAVQSPCYDPPMEKSVCVICQKPKALLTCGICQSDVCKYCAQFVDEESFSFLAEVPAEVSHTTYCGPCYDAKVAPQLDSYNDTMERAKSVIVYYKNQGKESRAFKRLEDPLNIPFCIDRDETLLRLAFLAAHKDFNALVDVDIVSEKVRSGAYQTLKWRGTGIPTLIDITKIKPNRF